MGIWYLSLENRKQYEKKLNIKNIKIKIQELKLSKTED